MAVLVVANTGVTVRQIFSLFRTISHIGLHPPLTRRADVLYLVPVLIGC